jgi:pimeloyl-ACP methyl ester carboxylesterase
MADTPIQSQTALVETLVDESGEEVRKSFWRGFGAALKKAAVATGRGGAWLAKTGYENRNYVPAVINGAIGDKLAERDDRLAIAMSFREDGRDVHPADLGRLDGHVAVFVHGLMADEAYWTRPFGDFEGLGPVLARERSLTPLYLRYNSGRHISTNGEGLARLLEQLVQAHPDIERLTLSGHSMGGLVARSAGHYGGVLAHAWVRRVESVVLLGSPTDGAYLEQAAHLSSWVLDAIPTLATNVIAQTINGRSDGIKDLRLGLLVHEDWQREDAATMRLVDRTEVPLMPGVHYHLAIGTLWGSTDSIVTAYLGDGLVGKKSALATRDYDGAASIRWRVFTKTTHLALVSSPEVQAFVSDALAVKKLLEA